MIYTLKSPLVIHITLYYCNWDSCRVQKKVSNSREFDSKLCRKNGRLCSKMCDYTVILTKKVNFCLMSLQMYLLKVFFPLVISFYAVYKLYKFNCCKLFLSRKIHAFVRHGWCLALNHVWNPLLSFSRAQALSNE